MQILKWFWLLLKATILRKAQLRISFTKESNGDGTYSYNMDLVKQMRGMGKDEPMEFFVKPTSENAGVLNDHITSNGGYMGIRFGPH